MATKNTPSGATPVEESVKKASARGADKKAADKAPEKKAAPKSSARPAPQYGEGGMGEVLREAGQELSTRAEIKKVTWPSKKELKVTTLAVLVLVAVMSIFLGVLDLGLVKAVEAITSIGR